MALYKEIENRGDFPPILVFIAINKLGDIL